MHKVSQGCFASVDDDDDNLFGEREDELEAARAVREEAAR